MLSNAEGPNEWRVSVGLPQSTDDIARLTVGGTRR
jgi:hypothetical protein